MEFRYVGTILLDYRRYYIENNLILKYFNWKKIHRYYSQEFGDIE